MFGVVNLHLLTANFTHNLQAAIRTAIFPAVFLLTLLLLPGQALALVNINTADSDTLQTLNGIGAAKAAAIIDYREQNGSFNTKEEIINVSGIGEATYNKIKSDITVGSVVADVPDDTVDEADTTNTDDGDTGSGQEVKPLVEALVLTAPKSAAVNQPIQFSVEPEAGTNERLIRYSWNFGDATVANERTPIHSYQYPGTYVVYVESYYQKKTKVARAEVKVFSLELELIRNLDNLVLTNKTKNEIDLSGMKLVGQSIMEFPPHSKLLAGDSLTLPLQSVGTTGSDTIALLDQAGVVLASTYVAPTIVPIRQFANTFVTKETKAKNLPEVETTETVTESVLPTTSVTALENQTAAVGDSSLPKKSWPYLGLIGMLSLAVFSIYSGRQA